MPLQPGTRLGPYEIVSPLGVGGMGEVYRATDTNLKRQVAIKVLPASVAGDTDRLARFQREAEVLASLNHPAIAHIHGLERSVPAPGSGQPATIALVMELVEGPTLAERIAAANLTPEAESSGSRPRDPNARQARESLQPGAPGVGPRRMEASRAPRGLNIEDALPIARQIAEALEAAHDQGIVHRDLKPANVKVRDDGAVKVLDFGLAKAMQPAVALSTSVSMPPTVTSPAMTEVGMILGTAAYMSPEQATGRPADKRADIWAFGVVLWEMLTGRRLFDGETISDTLADVLRGPIDFDALPGATPVAIRDLLRRCLDRSAKTRLRDIGEARIVIQRVLTQPDGPTLATPAPPPGQIPTGGGMAHRIAPWTIAGLLGAGLATILAIGGIRGAPTTPAATTHLRAELGADVSLETAPGANAVLSPDGNVVVFVGTRALGVPPLLYVRRLDQFQATALAGTNDAYAPFFSPDGQWVGFFAAGKLKRVSITGGSVLVLCDAPTGRGGAWAADGMIYFTPDGNVGSGLQRIPATGGKPEPVAGLPEGALTERWPQILPGGKLLLFTTATLAGGPSTSRIGALGIRNLSTGERKIVQQDASYGRYVPSGHLLYVRGVTLFAVPFDLARLEVTGPSMPAVDSIVSNPGFGDAQFSVSGTGTMVYQAGSGMTAEVPMSWMDKDGTFAPLRQVPANWTDVRFSPDGRHVAMDITDANQRDIWIYDWPRDTMQRLTSDPADDASPVWTPDGTRIVFASKRGNGAIYNLYWQRADGTGQTERLTSSPNHQIPESWNPEGTLLAFHEITPRNQTAADVMFLPMEGNERSGWTHGKPVAFLNTPVDEQNPMFSPDGKWLAYESNETGQFEIYVRPVQGPVGKWQVSNSGGTYVTWSRAKHELFWGTADQSLMVAPYTVVGTSFNAERPRPWSPGRFTAGQYRRFDIHPDGNRFAVSKDPAEGIAPKRDKVAFVFNAFDELRRLAPAKK